LVSVGIIGVGRMGRQLAEKLRGHFDLWLYDNDNKIAAATADELSVHEARFEQLFDLEVLILALPAEVMPEMVKRLAPSLSTKQILVNIATNQKREPLQKLIAGETKVVSAKIVGHAREIAAGEAPTIIVDGDEGEETEKISHIFWHFGTVQQGSEDLVEVLNTLASGEGIKAAYTIKKKMLQEGITLSLWETAVRNVAAGTMKAFASGDVGPFASGIIREMEDENDKG